jgi:hypothetical protein
VHLKRQVKPPIPEPVRKRRKIPRTSGGLESRLVELTPEDRRMVEAAWLGYSKPERDALEAHVRQDLAEYGWVVDGVTFRQAVLFAFIKATMYQRFKRMYPDWFKGAPCKDE